MHGMADDGAYNIVASWCYIVYAQDVWPGRNLSIAVDLRAFGIEMMLAPYGAGETETAPSESGEVEFTPSESGEARPMPSESDESELMPLGSDELGPTPLGLDESKLVP